MSNEQIIDIDGVEWTVGALDADIYLLSSRSTSSPSWLWRARPRRRDSSWGLFPAAQRTTRRPCARWRPPIRRSGRRNRKRRRPPAERGATGPTRSRPHDPGRGGREFRRRQSDTASGRADFFIFARHGWRPSARRPPGDLRAGGRPTETVPPDELFFWHLGGLSDEPRKLPAKLVELRGTRPA